jgi:predicted esterase
MPGLQRFSFSGASGREYVVYVPSTYTPSQPIRLVFALGGQGMTAEMTLASGWQTIAERDNVMVATLTPSSSGAGYSGAYDVPEFNLIELAEVEILRNYNIALRHVYYWGFSAGAHVTYMFGLTAERSNRIAAFAVHAGAIEAAATRTSPPAWPPQAGARRLPIYISCGTLDTAGSNGGLIGALRRNAEMLRAAGYPVETREVIGQRHTYSRADVEKAWTFLSAQKRS